MMKKLAIHRQPRNQDCADSMSLAERELAAFFGAVNELFGSELAELSAKQWLPWGSRRPTDTAVCPSRSPVPARSRPACRRP